VCASPARAIAWRCWRARASASINSKREIDGSKGFVCDVGDPAQVEAAAAEIRQQTVHATQYRTAVVVAARLPLALCGV